MENLDDEYIQLLIEEQLNGHETYSGENSEDTDLYRVLFTELGNLPLNTGESYLADRVVGKIWLKEEKEERAYDALAIFGVILLIFGLTYSAITLTNTVLPGQIVHFFVVYKSIFLFIVFVFSTIKFLDRYITKHRPTL